MEFCKLLFCGGMGEGKWRDPAKGAVVFGRWMNLVLGQERVRINDRGPFRRSRVLDLSYGAAKEIGMVRRGEARVEITPL